VELYTLGKEYNSGKIAYVKCLIHDPLKNIEIREKSFLMLLLTEGVATFKVGPDEFTATAPCFVCFSEKENPVLLKKRKLTCNSIYFHPQFLNINMTFNLIRSELYGDIAHTHDMFLLKPFLDNVYVVPILESYLDKLEDAFLHMKNELENQTDWYWSCRARSYFMEIIICLERLYGIIGRGDLLVCDDASAKIKNEKLKKAILFIESHYSTYMKLDEIISASKSNHTTITEQFKSELDITPMEYLWNYRISVAKKQLAFTEIPLKDVAIRCGFKTVQHFSRIFKEQICITLCYFENKH